MHNLIMVNFKSLIHPEQTASGSGRKLTYSYVLYMSQALKSFCGILSDFSWELYLQGSLKKLLKFKIHPIRQAKKNHKKLERNDVKQQASSKRFLKSQFNFFLQTDSFFVMNWIKWNLISTSATLVRVARLEQRFSDWINLEIPSKTALSCIYV